MREQCARYAARINQAEARRHFTSSPQPQPGSDRPRQQGRMYRKGGDKRVYANREWGEVLVGVCSEGNVACGFNRDSGRRERAGG